MINFEKYKEVIDEVAKWLFKVRFYNWGEPLMHKDIYRMVAYATEKNVGSEISTHLNVFKDKNVEELLESGLEKLIVSLDGTDEETYTTYRRGGDFKKVIENIALIMDAKKRRKKKYPVVELQMLAMRHNESQLGEMAVRAKELGVDAYRVGAVTINLKNKQDWEWLPADERLSRYFYHGKQDKIYSRRRKCEWLWRSAVINWDGTVSPCCVFEGRNTELGTLDGKGFSGVWNNEYYQAARSVFTSGGDKQKSVDTICARCRGMPVASDEGQHGLY
jgi:radical SAM protein with 4Fe4S-binding SPASM domain